MRAYFSIIFFFTCANSICQSLESPLIEKIITYKAKISIHNSLFITQQRDSILKKHLVKHFDRSQKLIKSEYYKDSLLDKTVNYIYDSDKMIKQLHYSSENILTDSITYFKLDSNTTLQSNYKKESVSYIITTSNKFGKTSNLYLLNNEKDTVNHFSYIYDVKGKLLRKSKTQLGKRYDQSIYIYDNEGTLKEVKFVNENGYIYGGERYEQKNENELNIVREDKRFKQLFTERRIQFNTQYDCLMKEYLLYHHNPNFWIVKYYEYTYYE